MRSTIWLLLVLLASAWPAQAASDGSAPPTGLRWVDGAITLASPDIRNTTITAELRLHREVLDGATLTAADMAKAYREDQGGFKSRIERDVKASFDARLAELFPGAQRTVPSVTLDASSVDVVRADPHDPPVRVLVAASVTRADEDVGLAGLTDAQVSAAFAAGAIVTTQATLRAQPGYSFTYTIQPPQTPRQLVFADGAPSATFVLDNTRGIDDLVRVVPLKLKDATAIAPTREDAAISVVIDLQDVDVTTGQAIQRDFGTLRAHVTVDSSLRAIAVPPNALARVGSSVELPFISADGIRLAIDAGLLTRDDLAGIDQTLLDTLDAGLTGALGARVEAEGGLDPETLAFHAESNVSVPLSKTASGTAAIALYSIPQSFTFPRVRGLDTTYTIILPRGLAVTGLQAEGGDVQTRQSSDGRQEFVVTPTAGQATATMSIAVTPSFVMAKFWPVVLLAALLLVLLVGSPVAVVVLRRRRGKRKQE